MEKWFVCSDIHDDEQALSAFADYAQAQGANRLIVLGDLALRPYDKHDLEQLIKNVDPKFLNAVINVQHPLQMQAARKFLTGRLDFRVAIKDFLKAKDADYGDTLGEMKRILDATGVPYHVIPGNYDSDIEHVFRDSNVHKKAFTLGEAKVLGYGGADALPPHIGLLFMLGEVMESEQIVSFDHKELYDLLKKEQPAVGFIHTPPHLLCDDAHNGENAGTPATTKYIVEHGPKLILSGHIHEAGPNGNNPNGVRGISGLNNSKMNTKTLVLNPGNLGRFELLHPQTLDSLLPIEKAFDYGTFSEVHVEPDGTPKKLFQYTVQVEGRSIGQVRLIGDFTI